MAKQLCQYCDKIIYKSPGKGRSSGHYRDPATGVLVPAHLGCWLDKIDWKGKKKEGNEKMVSMTPEEYQKLTKARHDLEDAATFVIKVCTACDFDRGDVADALNALAIALEQSTLDGPKEDGQ